MSRWLEQNRAAGVCFALAVLCGVVLWLLWLSERDDPMPVGPVLPAGEVLVR